MQAQHPTHSLPNPAVLKHQEKGGFTPLHLETRTAVDTATAAHHLGRQPQTLRYWACTQLGALQPVRVHGRLAWKVQDLKRLLEVQ